MEKDAFFVEELRHGTSSLCLSRAFSGGLMLQCGRSHHFIKVDLTLIKAPLLFATSGVLLSIQCFALMISRFILVKRRICFHQRISSFRQRRSCSIKSPACFRETRMAFAQSAAYVRKRTLSVPEGTATFCEKGAFLFKNGDWEVDLQPFFDFMRR